VYRDGSSLQVIQDYYGPVRTSSSLTLPPTASVEDGVVFVRGRDSLYAGCGTSHYPLWIGYTPWNHFGETDDGTLRCHAAELLAPDEWAIGSLSSHAGEGFFYSTKAYHYKFCLIYNGYERTPLTGAAVSANAIIPSEDADYCDVTLRLTGGTSALDKRVTGLELYRSELLLGDGYAEPREFYTLAATLDLTLETQDTDENAEGWYYSVSGDDAHLRFRDHGDVGYTYEAQSGIPEALKDYSIAYALATTLFGYLFIARCWKPDMKNGEFMLFRSKVHRYTMFNWAEDYCILPFVPTAISSWGGKLYVFNETTCLRIDPSSLVVEDSVEGIGSRGGKSVLSSEAGLFVVGAKNVYRISANGVEQIGDAVRTSQTSELFTPVSLDSLGTSVVPSLVWDAAKGALMALVNRSGNDYGLLVYVVKGGRWEYWTLPGAATGVLLCGKNNEILYGTTGILYKIQGHATRKSATWISSVMTFGRSGGKKKVYMVKASGTGTISYSVDTDTDWNSLSGNSLESADWLCTRFQYKAVIGPGEELRSLEVVYRLMEGIR
jgi:hypothetical protein